MRLPLGTLCLTLSCLPAVLPAVTNTWDKTTGNTDWTVGSNWTPAGGPPGANDIARFSGPHTALNSPTLAGIAAVGGIIVNNGFGDSTYINGAGTLTLGTNGVDLTNYPFHIYPDLLLDGSQTWTINRSTRTTDFRLCRSLGGVGPLTVTTAPTEYRGHAYLCYSGVVDQATFTGGLTIRRPRDVTAYLAVRYEMGAISGPGTYAFGGTPGDPGMIAGDNAVFEVNAAATTGGNTPGHIVTITNPLSALAGGLTVLTSQGLTVGHNPNIRFSGPINLGGVLISGISQLGDTLRFGGDLTLAQQTGERIGLSGRQFDYSAIRTEFSGGIADGSGDFCKPLVLRNLNSSLTLSGEAAGMTYAHGTVVDHCGADYLAYTRDAHVDIAVGSRLGTGAVRVLPGGVLRLNAGGNIPTGEVVQLGSSALARGVLALNYDGVPAVAGSGGVVAIDSTLSSPLDLSTLGAGDLFLGSHDDGTFSGASLTPGAGNLYRLGGGRQSAALTVSKSVLVGSAGLQVGAAAFRGGGTVYLTTTNTFTGPIEVIGLPAWWREPDITDPFSFLRGTGIAGGSPFGSTNGAVTLRCGQLGIVQGTSAAVTRKETLTFEGRSRLNLDCNTHENRLTFGSLVRSNRGVLAVYSNRGKLAGLEKIILESPPAQGNGMLPPWFVSDRGPASVDDQHYLTYDPTLGVSLYSAYTTDVNSLDATKVLGGGGALTANRACHAARLTSGLTGAYTLTVASGGIILDGGTASIGCNIDFGAAEGILYGNDIQSITGVVSGSGGLTLSGIDGHIRLLNRNNDFTGDITVSGGTLYADFDTAASHGSLGPTGNNITLNGGGLCQTKATGNTGYELSANRTLTLGACGGYIAGVGTNGSLVINSKITGPGVLMLSMENRDINAGTITIASAANDYAGGTHVLANGNYPIDLTSSPYTGVLKATAGAVLGTGDLLVGAHSMATLQGNTNVNANAGVQVVMTARVNFESASPAIGGLTGAGNVQLGAAGAGTELMIGGAAVNSTFYGKIYPATGATPCSVNKVGTGTFTLYGAHEYTGTTTVSGGTLALHGSLAGGLTVASGGTLKVVVGADGAVCLGSVSGDVVLNGTLELEVPSGVEIPMGTTLTALTVGGTITEDLLNAPAGYRIGTDGALTLTRAATGTVILVR